MGSDFVKKDRGFTLIELMVVVIVIAILAGIAIPSYFSQVRKARRLLGYEPRVGLRGELTQL